MCDSEPYYDRHVVTVIINHLMNIDSEVSYTGLLSLCSAADAIATGDISAVEAIAPGDISVTIAIASCDIAAAVAMCTYYITGFYTGGGGGGGGERWISLPNLHSPFPSIPN